MDAKRQLKVVLDRIVTQEQPDNLIAHFFARFWGTSIDRQLKTEQVFEQLQKLVRQYPDPSTLPSLTQPLTPPEEDFPEKDFRIKGIRISSLKGIPKSHSDHSYGFDLSGPNDEIKSAVILGTNGSGKSSIFSALEYIFCKEVSEKRLRGGKPDIESDRAYLNRFGTLATETQATVHLAQSNYSLVEPIWNKWSNFEQKARPSTHFVSDYDVYEIGMLSDDDIEERIASYLGLSEVMIAFGVLKNLSKYSRRKESIRLNQLQQQINTLNLTLDKSRQELVEIQKELETESIDSGSEAIEKTQKYISKLRDSLDWFKESPVDSKTLIDLADAFSKSYSRLREYQSFSESKDRLEFWQLGLKLLPRSNDCPFCGKSHLSVTEIEKQVKTQLDQFKEYTQREAAVSKSFLELQFALRSLSFWINNAVDVLKRDQTEFQNDAQMADIVERNRGMLKSIQDWDEYEGAIAILANIQGINAPRQSSYEQMEDIVQNRLLPLWNDIIQKLSDDYRTFVSERRQKIEMVISELQTSSNQGGSSRLEKKIQLENRKSQTLKTVASSEKEIGNLQGEIRTLQKQIDENNRISKGIAELFNGISKARNSIVKASVEDILESIRSLIADFWEKRERDIFDVVLEYREIASGDDTSSEKLFLRLKNRNTNEEIRPSEYLNTSRYRLLASSIAIALAMEVRKKENINLPFVIDDEFFAADIGNRSKAYSFVLKILSILKTSNLEAQLLIFTHDDLIFNSAALAFAKHFGATAKNKYILARIFQADIESDVLSSDPAGDQYWDLLFDLGPPIVILPKSPAKAKVRES